MTGEMSFICLVFLDSIAKSHIYNPTKNSNRILAVNHFREKAPS